ncbi:MAG: S9 family peptidase, partial [Flavobacterium sp.]
MNYIKGLLFLFLMASVPVKAQQKITLEQIWGGAFRTKGMDELQAMKNTNQYTVLNSARGSNSSQIDLYDFATLEKTGTLLDSKNHKELPGIDSYTFSPDEKKILIASNSEQIFRHSFLADYYIYDIASKSLTKLADHKVQEPSFSADNSKVAYAYENNLYVFDMAAKKHTQITKDGKKNAIINGITDWVYEEEFSFVKAYDWNAAGDKVAFIRFDETAVPEFSMDVYNSGLYPTQHVFKYPKAGEKNAVVSLHIYDVKANSTKEIK